MKLRSLIAVLLAAFITWIYVAPVASADRVSNSKHNFSGQFNDAGNVVSAQYAGDINEVCVYCHTPHNAGSNTLLWNKANKSGLTYRMYTSSRSLTRATVNASFSADSPSLLCLGCHDGKTALNVMHNSSIGGDDASLSGYPSGSKFIGHNGGATTPQYIQDNEGGFFISPQILNLGRNPDGTNTGTVNYLDNDHPIGFSYTSVLAERATGLFNVSEVSSKSSNRIRFFGPEKKVECSTCHNPHADDDDAATKPFLTMSNSGSAICLSCHNK